MSKRLNERFLSSYIELEKTCCEKFGVPTGGVTEYINRLNNARFAPGRDEALPRLVRYRGTRNICSSLGKRCDKGGYYLDKKIQPRGFKAQGPDFNISAPCAQTCKKKACKEICHLWRIYPACYAYHCSAHTVFEIK